VIPNLNSPVVDQTIASLENQEYNRSQFEVIVVGMDNPGLVHPSELVRHDPSDHPLPPAIARNRGASQARGEVIAFTDADCIAHPDWLAVLAKRFADPSVAVVGGGVDFEDRIYWTLADNIGTFYEYLTSRPPGERAQLPSINLGVRRKLFLEVGGFDERYPRPAGEDSDLTIRLHRKGYILHFEPRAIVKHIPPRNSLPDLLRHGYYRGKYSIKVDPRYAAEVGLIWPFHTRWGVLLGAPLLAAGATIRVFTTNRNLYRYWYTLPAIFGSKFAWCVGAASRP
jgi:glycosyltransferase involved in cell wall biosynthesis